MKPTLFSLAVLFSSQLVACGGVEELGTTCEQIEDALWKGYRDVCRDRSDCCYCECVNGGQEYYSHSQETGCECEDRQPLTEEGCNNLLFFYDGCEANPSSCVYDGRTTAESMCAMTGD